MRNGSKEKVDLELENRRAKVLALYCKNLNQEEIALELKVDQSTISRDLSHLRQQANRNVIELSDNLSFEYLKYLASSDVISRELWEISNFQIDPNDMDTNYIMNVNMSNKNKIIDVFSCEIVFQ